MTKPSTSGPDHPQFAFVLFGGTGDLSMRKILPALYQAHRDGTLAASGTLIAVARAAHDRAGFVQWVNEQVKPHVPSSAYDDAAWRGFLERLSYVRLDVTERGDF